MAHHEIKAPKKFEAPKTFQKVCLALFVIGFATFAVTAMNGSHAAWNGYLIGFWFSLSLALAGPFINSTQYLAIAGWSVSIRRIGEALGAFIPATVVLFIALYFGGSHLYHWWDQAYVAGDPILSKKQAWLNPGFFAGSSFAALIGISVMTFIQRKISLQADEGGAKSIYPKQKAAAAMWLIVFVIGFSFLAWNLLMSLEPHWFSTMWAVYMFAGMFQSGLALMIIILLYLIKNDYLGDFGGERQIHDLGQLFFGFTVFYAYIGFSQFLLIWYANIPEEAIWFVARGTPPDVETGWDMFSVALPILKFILPFLILLPQEHKKNKNNILVFVAYWILVMQLFEVWFWVAPTPHEAGALASPVHLPIVEIVIAFGFLGALGFVASTALSRANLVPVKDPFLHESIGHHHHGVRPPAPEEIKIS